MPQIDYKNKKQSLSWGRNGLIWTNGLHLEKSIREVRITPVNSRGNLSSCFICLPINQIQDLINELEKLK